MPFAQSYFLTTFSLLFLLSIVCMYIFLALLLYLHMKFYSNTELENDRWTVETSFITRLNFYCKKKSMLYLFKIPLVHHAWKPHMSVSWCQQFPHGWLVVLSVQDCDGFSANKNTSELLGIVPTLKWKISFMRHKVKGIKCNWKIRLR